MNKIDKYTLIWSLIVISVGIVIGFVVCSVIYDNNELDTSKAEILEAHANIKLLEIELALKTQHYKWLKEIADHQISLRAEQ